VTVDPGSAVALSVSVAATATAAALVPAAALAWILARWRFRGKALVTAAVALPLVLPPVVTGLVLLRVFGRASALGRALAAVGVPVVFSWWGAVLAAAVVGFPLYVLTLRAAFEQVDARYEAVSLTLGVPPAQTGWRITLPLALPGIAAATALAFGRALGEFGATAVLAGNVEGRTRTIALAVYALQDAPDGDAQVRPLVLASVALSALALGAYELLTRSHRRRLDLDGD
jgi:molybdate transport system permease protein